jgi:hypothetical protein
LREGCSPQEGLKARLMELHQTRDAAADGLQAAQAAAEQQRRAVAAAAEEAERERAALRAECDALTAAADELRGEVRAAADARDEAAAAAHAEVCVVTHLVWCSLVVTREMPSPWPGDASGQGQWR